MKVRFKSSHSRCWPAYMFLKYLYDSAKQLRASPLENANPAKSCSERRRTSGRGDSSTNETEARGKACLRYLHSSSVFCVILGCESGMNLFFQFSSVLCLDIKSH